MSPRPALRRRVASSAALVVCLTPLLFGGALPFAHRAIVCVVIAAAFSSVLMSSKTRLSRPSLYAIWALIGVVALVALQLVPLPCKLVDFVAGDGRGRFLEAVRAALGQSKTHQCTLSYDRGSTASALATQSATLAAFLIGVISASVSRSARPVVRSIAFGTTATCVVTLAHSALSMPRVYGYYEPVYALHGLVGPLLNPNHLALVGSLGVLGAGHLLLVEKNTFIRLAAISAVILDGTTVVATHSRGGLANLGLALLALAFVAFRTREGTRALSWKSAIALVVGIGATFGLTLALEWEAAIAEFENTPLKTQLILDALRQSFDTGALGAGRGAFAAAFAPNTDEAGRAMYPENLLAQWTYELGFVPGLFLFVALVVAALSSFWRSKRGGTAVVSAMVLVAVAHDLADFATEMVPIASMTALALGACLQRTSRERSLEAPRVQALALGIATSFAALGLFLSAGPSLNQTYALSMNARSEAELERARRSLREALVSHPYEPALYIQLAANAVARGDDVALKWANLARRRAPRWESSHLVLASHFFARGRSAQAIAELASLRDRNPRRVVETLCAHESKALTPLRVARLFPREEEIVEMANSLRRCMDGERFLPIVEAAIASGRSEPTLEVLAIETLASVEGEVAAEARYLEAITRHPDSAAIALGGATLAQRRRDGVAASERAQRAENNHGPLLAVQAALARAASLRNDRDARDRAIARLEVELEAGRLGPADVHALKAECAELEGRMEDAEAEYLRVYEATQNPDVLLHIEALALRSGRSARAAEAIRLLCRNSPGNPRCNASPGAIDSP